MKWFRQILCRETWGKEKLSPTWAILEEKWIPNKLVAPTMLNFARNHAKQRSLQHPPCPSLSLMGNVQQCKPMWDRNIDAVH